MITKIYKYFLGNRQGYIKENKNLGRVGKEDQSS